MSNTYEIEIKSLLGSKDRADDLREKILHSEQGFKLSSEHKQLNHYFNLPTDLEPLLKNIAPLLSEDKKITIKNIITDSKNISIRTRDADCKIIFVAKASIGDDTSANGVSRLEFEATMPFKTLDELDSLLLKSGLSYQAKWSRDREEYKGGNMTICLDKNAGYGYLAEFEKVVSGTEEKDGVRKELEEIMSEMGAVELKQDRLERMFAYYNAHWQDYYGTDKVFNIE